MHRAARRIVPDPQTGCWQWRGHISAKGYGRMAAAIQGKQVYAHRLVYEFFRGDVAEGLTLDHLCRNRACVNPWHLEPVTIRENCRRGVGWVRRHTGTCRRGHPQTPENVYTSPAGHEQCRICMRLSNALASRRYRARKAKR